MKHATFVFILLIAFPLFAIGQDFTITASDRGHITLHFELDDFSIDTVEHEGELMHTIDAKGIVMPNDYGLPALPTFNRFIAIPQGSKVVVETRTTRDERMAGINIAPSVGSQCENDPERPFFKDKKVYNSNSLYPAETVLVANPQQLRGVDVVHLGLSPFQFNPVTRELAIHREIDINIRFEGGNDHFGDDRLRSPYWDPILQNNILNYNCLKGIDYDTRRQQWSQNRSTGCEYLIITPDNDAFYNAGIELADYRCKQGILTKVMRVTETGAADPDALKQWFRDIYATWDIPPAAVCLIGESGDNLQQYVPGYPTFHPKDNLITSDNPYADINDDDLPDICFTRLIAQNASELPLFIGKQIEYEYTNPVSDPNYYAHPVTAAGWQNEKWFQLTIATISGYLTQHGKTPHRINEIYSGEQGPNWSTAPNTSTLVNYFGPNGLGYIPASPNELGGWTGGTAQDVINAINGGAYLVQHRDHGWNTKWYQPEIYTTDFGGINNAMTYLISVNCRTGMYDNSTVCFTEALIRMTRNGKNAGIVGAIAPVGQTYSYANDIFLWGVWDYFDPSFLPEYGPYAEHTGNWLPSFACVAGKYFLSSHVFPNADSNMFTTTSNTFHTHGDAFLRIFTKVPQIIEATHDETIQCFEPFHITAPEGSQIALTAYLDGQWHILATATGTGEEQEIAALENVPTESIHLTITGQNMRRLEKDILLAPFDRPFVVVDSITMNSGNLTLHYNQSVVTDIQVTNVGMVGCNGGSVTFTSGSEYLSLNQGEASFEALPYNASQLLSNAFLFSLSDNIPDQSHIPFSLTTHFGEETYTQNYEIVVLSPNIKTELIAIDDSQGNQDGRLDPGEFASLTFRITNNGHYQAESPHVSMRNRAGYIRIITPEMTLNDLEVDASVEVTFDVYVEYIAGEVPFVYFMLQTDINNLSFEQEIRTSIGYVLDNFEAEMFEPCWTNDPDHPWHIVNSSMSFDGNHCAKSGEITHDESSQLALSFTSTKPGNISFYRRVSSEDNYDYLIFYVDGVELGRWSGELWWSEQSYTVDSGLHQYQWVYLKDYSVDNGSDCAWIDYITLPPNLDANEERTELPLDIHPNPTTDLITIDLEPEEYFSISVYDAKGHLILTENHGNVLSLKGIPTGLYHIVAEQNGQRWHGRIVKL